MVGGVMDGSIIVLGIVCDDCVGMRGMIIGGSDIMYDGGGVLLSLHDSGGVGMGVDVAMGVGVI